MPVPLSRVRLRQAGEKTDRADLVGRRPLGRSRDFSAPAAAGRPAPMPVAEPVPGRQPDDHTGKAEMAAPRDCGRPGAGTQSRGDRAPPLLQPRGGPPFSTTIALVRFRSSPRASLALPH